MAEIRSKQKSVTGQTVVVFGIIFLLIVASVVKQLTSGSGSGLRKFISPDKSFTIILPGDVKEKRQKMASEIGSLELFTYSAKSENYECFIIYVDYPHFFIEEMKPEVLLDGSVDGVAVDIGGTLMKATVIDLQGNPGRELKIAGMNKEVIKIRLFLVGNRLYQLKVVCEPDLAMNKNANVIFDSFKLNGIQKKGK